MRADEHGWDTYGPPHVGEVRVSAVELGSVRDGPMLQFPVAESNQDEPLSAVDAALRDARVRLSAAAKKP